MYMYIHEMVANDARNAAIGKEFIREVSHTVHLVAVDNIIMMMVCSL